MNCETNIDDCEGVSCESGVCVDGLDVSFCECEFGKVGANCGKGMYDISLVAFLNKCHSVDFILSHIF